MGTNLLLHCSYFKRVFSSQKFNQIPIVYNNIFLNFNTLKPKNYTLLHCYFLLSMQELLYSVDGVGAHGPALTLLQPLTPL